MNKFENKYEMTEEKFYKYIIPIFYKEKPFIIYAIISIIAFISFLYLDFFMHEYKYGLFALSLVFVVIYIFIFRKIMTAHRQYKIITEKELKNKGWECKYKISDDGIDIYINEMKNNYVPWSKIKWWTEAKSYIALRWGMYLDAVILDKESFTIGTMEEFINYMKNVHDDIPFKNEDPAFYR